MDMTRLVRYVVIWIMLLLLVFECDAGNSEDDKARDRVRSRIRRRRRVTGFRTRSSGAYRGRVTSGVPYRTIKDRVGRINTRYSRAYSSTRIGSVYYGYYSLYYYQAGLYSRRTRYSKSTLLCENYEADVNKTAIGWFKCPFPFEPNSYTLCCGDRYAEFCCKPDYGGKLSAGAIAGIVIVVLIMVAGGIACVALIFIKKRKESNTDQEPNSEEESNFVHPSDNKTSYGTEPPLNPGYDMDDQDESAPPYQESTYPPYSPPDDYPAPGGYPPAPYGSDLPPKQ